MQVFIILHYVLSIYNVIFYFYIILINNEYVPIYIYSRVKKKKKLLGDYNNCDNEIILFII